jgi:hypothetical protein
MLRAIFITLECWGLGISIPKHSTRFKYINYGTQATLTSKDLHGGFITGNTILYVERVRAMLCVGRELLLAFVHRPTILG